MLMVNDKIDTEHNLVYLIAIMWSSRDVQNHSYGEFPVVHNFCKDMENTLAKDTVITDYDNDTGNDQSNDISSTILSCTMTLHLSIIYLWFIHRTIFCWLPHIR